MAKPSPVGSEAGALPAHRSVPRLNWPRQAQPGPWAAADSANYSVDKSFRGPVYGCERWPVSALSPTMTVLPLRAYLPRLAAAAAK